MSNIIDYLQKILSSRYGKDVRQAIHDGILTCYEDGKAGAIDLVARERIDALESSALVRKIVDSLPTSNISTTTVYMIPSQQSSQDNIYDEYMYINESWEKIGSSAVDLTDYLKKDGDSSNNTVTFTSGDSESATEWTDVGVLASGEKHSSFLTKTSTMFKNIRFLKNFLGNNDISALGDGTVTGGLVTLNDSLNVLNSNWISTELSLSGITVPDGVTISNGGYCMIGSLIWLSILVSVTEIEKEHKISGFPKPKARTALYTHKPDRLGYAYMHERGELVFSNHAVNGIWLCGFYPLSLI